MTIKLYPKTNADSIGNRHVKIQMRDAAATALEAKQERDRKWNKARSSLACKIPVVIETDLDDHCYEDIPVKKRP